MGEKRLARAYDGAPGLERARVVGAAELHNLHDNRSLGKVHLIFVTRAACEIDGVPAPHSGGYRANVWL